MNKKINTTFKNLNMNSNESKEIQKREENLLIRPVNFNEDFDQLIELYDLVFENELSAKGTSARKLLEEHKKALPLLKIIGIFSRGLKHALDGFVYENVDGKIIASVSIGYSFNYWEISMVATHPDYRRKGLAKRLLAKAIEHAKTHKAKIITLEVISDNTPAYSLYTKLGFIHYDSSTKLNIDVKNIPNGLDNEFPEKYKISEVKKNKNSNQERYELAKASTPESVSSIIPINRKQYFKPLIIRILRPLMIRLLGLKFNQTGVYFNKKLVGTSFVDLRKKEESVHELDIVIDPKHIEELTKPLIAHDLNKFKKNLDFKDKVYTTVRSSSQFMLESCEEVGFKVFEQDHFLALKL